MFRILVVEDVPNTFIELCELLKEVFVNSQIEASMTVEEGLAMIRRAAEKKYAFDVAILDFKLPQRQGENSEIDESLCKEIKRLMPETLVIHITAFGEDRQVAQHVKDYHSDRRGTRVELIPKNAYWPEKLLAEMKTYLYGKRIEDQLASLFSQETRAVGRSRKVESARGSLTHELAALSREISSFWADLDDVTKNKIREFFNVVEDENKVHVNLIVG